MEGGPFSTQELQVSYRKTSCTGLDTIKPVGGGPKKGQQGHNYTRTPKITDNVEKTLGQNRDGHSTVFFDLFSTYIQVLE